MPIFVQQPHQGHLFTGKCWGGNFKLLQVSYTVFMFTLILSIIAFVVAHTSLDKII